MADNRLPGASWDLVNSVQERGQPDRGQYAGDKLGSESEIHWYLRYSLSYRDLEEMMLERVQRYAPELEKRCRPHPNTTSDSWRMDETSVKIKKHECTSIKPWIQKG